MTGRYEGFEQGPLRLYTPCRIKSTEQQAAALAIVHAELILSHPFREGNGRCARLLAMLMGLPEKFREVIARTLKSAARTS
jgi:fido (protein-threonine AMPylation protein)